MKYKVLQLNADGTIIFTKEELENLLDEVYQEGYAVGRHSDRTYPLYPYYSPPELPRHYWWDVWCGDHSTADTTTTTTPTMGSATTTANTTNIKYDKVTG